MRRTMFLFQDGVVVTSIVSALDQLGVVEPSLERERSLAELLPELTPTGFGYLRAALRCLAGVGWLENWPSLDPATAMLRWTDAGRALAAERERHLAVAKFLAGFHDTAADAWARPWNGERADAFVALVARARERWDLSDSLPMELRAVAVTQLDAGLAVPAMVWLHSTGRLAGESPSLPGGEVGTALAELLEVLGWTHGTDRWTELGLQAAAFAAPFGIVASYLPLLAGLPEHFRGRPSLAPRGAPEGHVHRGLNVIASAAAHRRYFADADGIVVEVFDREPVEEQPSFIADVGCGDGSWLVHLYELVRSSTLRGRRLGEHSLLMVGVDCNATALERARAVLEGTGVPALLLLGDVGDPDGLRDLLARHDLAIEDGLHVRAFVDHDRAYAGRGDGPASGWSSGAYVDREGVPLAAADVERDLTAHLKAWAGHARRHGLVMLEAHSVPAEVARRHLGAQHSAAFDAYHCWSHQYPVDHAAYLQCAREAGLQADTHTERRYPASRPFVAVSVNRFIAAEREEAVTDRTPVGPPAHTWRPAAGTDLEDGLALHRLLYHDGDVRHPKSWHAGATGHVVAGAARAIESALERTPAGNVIRVLDYGAGTGAATIELLKACRARGLERRLADRGVLLELHLADLSSSWFAQAFELLRNCGWARFHSLRGTGGGFRPLAEVLGGLPMQVVMANMVFHLISPVALGRAARELAGALVPGGRLLWSSPDLAPAGPYAVLFHDANRAVRRRWLGLLGGREPAARAPVAAEAARRARAALDEDDLEAAGKRAARRILPRPNKAAEVVAALSAHLRGEIELRTYEMLDCDLVDALLVPSNNGEYLPEIEDRSLRERVVRELMLGDVLPELGASAAGTGLGLGIRWTLGDFRRP